MDVKRILITSDDGFDSLGVRLLIKELKDDYEVGVVGTVKQQSGVGGLMHFAHGCEWGTQQVDGVEVLWVDGAPCDGVAAAQAYFDKPFDLVVSGINWGPNVGGAGLVSSGTYSAAVRAIGLNVAPRAMALSWDVPMNMWFKRYEGSEPIPEELFDHPGNTAGKMIRKAISKDMWGSKLLNINFPTNKTTESVFVGTIDDLTKYYVHPNELDINTRRLSYVYKVHEESIKKGDMGVDVVALKNGKITITPCVPSMVDEKVLGKLRG